LFDERTNVVKDAQALILSCECTHGCPACVGPILAPDERRDTSPKTLAAQILALFSTEEAV
jgi:DEAD/DEAH box helicase domain-containing protein